MRLQAADTFRIIIMVILSVLVLVIYTSTAKNISKDYEKGYLSGTLIPRLGITTNNNDIPLTTINESIIKLEVCIHKSININDFKNFLKNIENYFKSQGIDIKFKIYKIKTYSRNTCPCWKVSDEADLLMCVGPGEGGYIGRPYYRVGVNTNPPYGFTKKGVEAEAHEIVHYLGFEDLYVLSPSYLKETINGLPSWIYNDLMYSANFGSGLKINYITKEIILFNLKNLKKYGREGIVYPIQRFELPCEIEVIFSKKYSKCKTILYYSDSGHIETKVIYTRKITDNKFSFYLPDDCKKANTCIAYKIICGSDYYWIAHYQIIDECFIKNNFKPVDYCKFNCYKNHYLCKLI